MVGVPHHGVVTGGCLPGSVSRELRRVEPIDQAVWGECFMMISYSLTGVTLSRSPNPLSKSLIQAFYT